MAEHNDPHEHQHSEGSKRVREVVRDGFTIMLAAASWAFEQGDQMIDSWLHQAHVRRAEERGRRVSESMRSAMPVATRDQIASLERQVAELKSEVESLKANKVSQ